MQRTDEVVARPRVHTRLWVAIAATAVLLTACAGGGVTDDDFESLSSDVTEIKGEQRTVAREVESLQREVESIAAELATAAHQVAEAGADGSSGSAHAVVGSAAAEHEAPHWTYAGETGPEMWGSLLDDWTTCATGTTQSPINIAASLPIGLTDVQFEYAPAAVTVINNGHTIQGNVAEGSGVMVDGERYELLQFHFHAPSEHEVNGKPAAMEAHFVHRNADGQLAVIGVLYELGAHNPTLDAVWAALPATIEDETHLDAFVPESMFPLDRSVFRYPGSLTTPPCSEGVRWHVMTSPQSVSAEQVGAFIDIVGENARPVQPLNGRPVLADVAKG